MQINQALKFWKCISGIDFFFKWNWEINKVIQSKNNCLKSSIEQVDQTFQLYRALVVTNWPKWSPLSPNNFSKNHRWNIFSNISSGQQYLSSDIKKSCQNWLVKKSKFVWKNPPRAKIFRYFCYESWNNNFASFRLEHQNLVKKAPSKMASLKVEICLKKPTPSKNIPLLLLRKLEQ